MRTLRGEIGGYSWHLYLLSYSLDIWDNNEGRVVKTYENIKTIDDLTKCLEQWDDEKF